MRDPLATVWACFETDEPCFAASEVALWPAGDRHILQKMGVIVEGVPAQCTICPACDLGHAEELEFLEEGTQQGFILCPVAGRVPITADQLRTWTIDFDALAVATAQCLRLEGKTKALVPGHLWRLGTTRWDEKDRLVILGRRLNAVDVAATNRHLIGVREGIVLTSSHGQLGDIWTGMKPTCVAIDELLSLNEGLMRADVVTLHAHIRSADAVRDSQALLKLNEDDFRRIVRREVVSQMKLQLTDDIMIRAYALHGTARAAEAALRSDGYVVDHSTIARAVERRRENGADHGSRTEDSASVVRTVVSHGRDKKKRK